MKVYQPECLRTAGQTSAVFSGQDMTAFCCCVRMGQQQSGNDFAGCKHSLRRYLLNLSALRCKQTAFRMKARNNASLYGKQDTLIETAEAPAPPTSCVLPPTFSFCFCFHMRKEGTMWVKVCQRSSSCLFRTGASCSGTISHSSFLISHFKQPFLIAKRRCDYAVFRCAHCRGNTH